MKQILLVIIMAATLMFGGCAKTTSKPVTVSDFLLNTYVSITIYDSDKSQVASDALELCREYEKIFSRTWPDSALYELNNKGQITDANPLLYDLIRIGLEYCRLTEGALDISIEPLITLWNITSDNPKVPDVTDITNALTLVSYDKIILDEADHSIHLNDNVTIDLGAIAKGYIADLLKEYLIANGVTSGTIDLGGNIVCIGTKPDGTKYNIGIKEPVSENPKLLTAVRVADMSVVTSGTYERFFVQDNVTYHHIIDPATGYPANSGLISVTIISKESVVGDCLSTACLVMGRDRALTLINSIDDVYGILVDENMQIYYSDGAENVLHK